MSEELAKKRFNRALNRAINFLNQPEGPYKIILLNTDPFHIEAIREKEIRKIRIVLDKITQADEKALRDFKLPHICTKEIWFKKHNERNFH